MELVPKASANATASRTLDAYDFILRGSLSFEFVISIHEIVLEINILLFMNILWQSPREGTLGFDLTYWGVFLAGLISFASPCVLPLVPPYLCFLAGTSLDQLTDEHRTKQVGANVVVSSLFFVLGFATVFVALGASATFVGDLVTSHLTWLGYVAGVIIILMGLHFLGVLRIPLLYREARHHVQQKPAGFLGAYIVGLAFAFGWTPCVGPVLATILFVAGSEETALQGASLLFVYALGIGIPFVLAAMFAGPFMGFMSRFKKHLGLVEKIMGALLVVTGILFLTGGMPYISYLMLEWFPQLGTIG